VCGTRNDSGPDQCTPQTVGRFKKSRGLLHMWNIRTTRDRISVRRAKDGGRQTATDASGTPTTRVPISAIQGWPTEARGSRRAGASRVRADSLADRPQESKILGFCYRPIEGSIGPSHDRYASGMRRSASGGP
jgi:hypothetical protein